jgi:hypothetical protein
MPPESCLRGNFYFRVTISRPFAPIYKSMSPFWGSFFEQVRSGGRNATVFLLAFAACFVVLLAAGMASELNAFQYAGPVLTAVIILVALRFAVATYKARNRPRERFRRKPLSSDEARVARSKLLKRNVSNNWQQ